jgi:uracil-DNA glycosylase
MPKFPTGGVMLVAHNLDGADAFQARLEQGTPHGDPRFPRRLMPTWRNLYDLLGAAGVSRENCFFTNAYVGLNGQGVIGPFAGSRDQQFSAWCRDFLTMQIAAMQPGAVIALGVDARRFMSGMADDLRPWRRSGDPASLTLTLAGVETTVVSVSHPARVQTGEARAADARTLSMALPPRIF